MTVLITGGAGYIGSHAVLAFRDAGYEVIVIDNLATGRRDAVPTDVRFIQCDAGNFESVQKIIRSHGISSVIHFAGSLIVPESVETPLAYYLNNTVASRNLIEVCVNSGVHHLIFSSTAAVYGIPQSLPIRETDPTNPINPYGRSKLMTEWILKDVADAHELRFVILRYFNVAGADPIGRAGQSTPNATQLIKVATQTAMGLRDGITIFGEDYDTPDGTCIRDYIHVTDLVNAHVRALQHLEADGQSDVLNCGYGHGFSVMEVLDKVREVAGREFPTRIGPRRPGDAPEVFADVSRIREVLDWHPSHDDLAQMIASTIRWESTLSRKQMPKPH